MPHLIIETSTSLTSEVVKKLHYLVGEQETVSIEAVKTRLYPTALSFAGNQPENTHTALTLKLLPGRSEQLKEQMASNLFNGASELIKVGTLSVEVVDLGIYKK